ncbi:MAG TPA: ComEC/Rec2 family competence protein, partial [Acidobacteriota bacterium]|nr:ComEC/Rec2 family competence protein [Acidobacteriota bacterium]
MNDHPVSHDGRSERRMAFVLRHSNRAIVAVAICFATGVASASFCRDYSFAGLLFAAAALIIASLMALRHNRLFTALASGLGAVILCGFLTALANRDAFPDSDLRALISGNIFPLDEPVFFEGCAVTDGEKRGADLVSTIAIRRFRKGDTMMTSHGKGILRVAIPEEGSADEMIPRLTQGDKITGWASWRLPHNYENPGSADRTARLARRGIRVTGRSKSFQLLEMDPGGCSTLLIRSANTVRANARWSLTHVGSEENRQPAAILASITIGDYSRLAATTREVFKNTGTFHVLVVSGLHVVWITALLLYFLKLIRLPERIRHLLAAIAIFAYACVVGFQASITRCLWVFVLYLAGRAMFRRSDPLNVLFGAALILLAANPDWLFETGFQLSFLSVIAIILTAVPAIEKYLKPLTEPLRHAGDPLRLFLSPGTAHRRGRALRVRYEMLVEEAADRFSPALDRPLLWAGRGFARVMTAAGSMVALSASIQLWIEPLLAHYYNRISHIAPLANIVIVPLASLTMVAGISGSLAMPLLGPFLLHCAGYFASLLLSITSLIAAIPGAWQRCPTPAAPWILLGITFLFLWGFFRLRRFMIPAGYIIVMLVCLSFGSSPGVLFRNVDLHEYRTEKNFWPPGAAILSLTFLDVGQGDSIIIRFPDGRVWVLDAGGMQFTHSEQDDAFTFDIGEAVVSRFLWHGWTTRLDRLVLSHTDLDHTGGMPAIINNFRIKQIDYPWVGSNAAILDELLELARKKKTDGRPMGAGTIERFGAVEARALNPPMDLRLRSPNDNSLVHLLKYGKFSVLLAGDLEKAGEAEVLSRPEDLTTLLLKVAHHGSRSATSEAFLERTRPRWAVISAGRNNRHGHPSLDVTDRLDRFGVRLFVTAE